MNKLLNPISYNICSKRVFYTPIFHYFFSFLGRPLKLFSLSLVCAFVFFLFLELRTTSDRPWKKSIDILPQKFLCAVISKRGQFNFFLTSMLPIYVQRNLFPFISAEGKYCRICMKASITYGTVKHLTYFFFLTALFAFCWMKYKIGVMYKLKNIFKLLFFIFDM